MPAKTPSVEQLQAAADEGRTREDPRVDDEMTRRGGRTTLGGFEQNLRVEFDIPDGYVARWIIHEGERIIRALRSGYQFLDKENESCTISKGDLSEMETHIRKVTGRLESGAPQMSYLMVQKKEFYEEDQRSKQSEIDELDNAIAGNTLTPNDGNVYHSGNLDGRKFGENPFSR